MSRTTRRRLLRGMIDGAAVTVALPFLACFLNGNGDALAKGVPLPVRFGTWFWGLGMDHTLFTPKTMGANYELLEQLAPLKGYQQHVNIYSNFDVPTDGRSIFCHYTGWVALRSGEAPVSNTALPRESIDMTVADDIGTVTQFPSLQLAATGNPRTSYSFRNADAVNPPDVSPQDFYARIFSPAFRNPNAPDFEPDPQIMMRKSALSAVTEQKAGLLKTLGAEDKARLDAYFTAVRTLEKRLALQSEKPPPTPGCRVPAEPKKELPVGVDVEVLATRHALMVDLLVLALACNQTKVFNIAYSEAGAQTTREGALRAHHPQTHEEPKDLELGYQPGAAWFVTRAMESWAYLVKALAEFHEGDGILLDRCLVYAHSDTQLAQIHSLKGTPMMTAGTAGGRIKTGIHVDGRGSPGTRVGLTALQAMGLKTGAWGANSLKTSQPVGEVIV